MSSLNLALLSIILAVAHITRHTLRPMCGKGSTANFVARARRGAIGGPVAEQFFLDCCQSHSTRSNAGEFNKPDRMQEKLRTLSKILQLSWRPYAGATFISRTLSARKLSTRKICTHGAGFKYWGVEALTRRTTYHVL